MEEASTAYAVGQLLAQDMLLNLNEVQLSVLLLMTSEPTRQRELIRALRTAAQERSQTT